MKILHSFMLTVFTLSALAFDCSFPDLGKIPVLAQGRVKPLMVHASESIKLLTGSKQNSLNTYCLLSTSFNQTLTFSTKNDFLQQVIGASQIDYQALVAMQMKLTGMLEQLPPNDSRARYLDELMTKITLYSDIILKRDWMIPDNSDGIVNWIPLAQFDDTTLLPALNKAFQNRDQINPTNQWEIFYHQVPLTWIGLFALLCSLLSGIILKSFRLTVGFSSAGLLTLTMVLLLRLIISGRAPLANMYESVLFTGYSALLIGLIISVIKKDKFILIIGTIISMLGLFMANLSDQMLDSSIGPLVPVLRSNFWLSTHVSTIIISYGAFALSWLIGNIAIIKKSFFNQDHTYNQKYFSDIIYLCLKFGVVFLAAGIILGAIWADYAWGRFWGWDPKETWSLIVLLIYMIIIHGRYTSWIPQKRFIHLTTAAFMSVIMAWFGVNYILATGMHSYGFRSGGTIFVVSFILIQILILVATFCKILFQKETWTNNE